MIDYDGPAPRDRANEKVRPATRFERALAKAHRRLGGSKRDQASKLGEATGRFDVDQTRQLALAGEPLDHGGIWDLRREDSPMLIATRKPGEFGASAIEFFLSLGANPDHRAPGEGRVDRGLATSALRHGQWKGAALIMAKSKDPLAADDDGLGAWGAFAAACELVGPWGGSPKWQRQMGAMADVLEGLGANPNERLTQEGMFSQGATPLWIAAGWVPMVEALLARGAGPNVADVHGVTPLMRACALGWGEMDKSIKTLLAAGADASAVDQEGHDALWWLIHGWSDWGKTRGGDPWRSGLEGPARDLIKAGAPCLERSRFERMRDPDLSRAQPVWVGVVRAFEERLALEAQCVASRREPGSRRL
jgi:hypothetical protein